jgi:tetratricopeptide (TPR) repeat protein
VGLLEQGMHDFTNATDFNPSNNGAHYRIGETHLFGCQYQKALDKFETIDPDFNPDIRAAHISLALIGLGRKEDALKSLRTYLDAHPDDAGGLVTSVEAIVHALFQRHAEAEEAIARAVGRRGLGHFHHTQYHVACAYALMDKKDSAIEWLRKSSSATRIWITSEVTHASASFLPPKNNASMRSNPSTDRSAEQPLLYGRFLLRTAKRNFLSSQNLRHSVPAHAAVQSAQNGTYLFGGFAYLVGQTRF